MGVPYTHPPPALSSQIDATDHAYLSLRILGQLANFPYVPGLFLSALK